MAAVQNPPGRTDWADDDDSPDLATALPAPQITKNKDGTETVVTIFFNEDGKKVKRTQRIRRTVVKKKENPRVAERRQWAKIGPEAGKPPGPRSDTTTMGENIIFRPQAGFKAGGVQEVNPQEDKKADALKKMQIKCRICSGDHFTTKCPFKDTMAPEGDAAPVDMDAVAGDGGAGGGGGIGGSYVPPHLRKGGAGTGERMGGKYERDDLATLRVTNVSAGQHKRHQELSANLMTRSLKWPTKASCATHSSASVGLLVSSSPRTARRAERRVSHSCHMPIVAMRHGRVRRWTATVITT